MKIKPCMNDMCPLDYYNKKYGNKCKDKKGCPKYIIEKSESAWDMANRLLEVIAKLPFKEQEYYICKFPYAKKYKNQDAIKKMQEIEKELKE
ncbi:hypothetical protein LCGC14_0794300 [marine sediment metagenome]|uniref:Uncharacterized protein n=1 Tax=marine sediment metagenome TaxID=412755 RepID=A0A0F9SYT4_9ZZZZ